MEKETKELLLEHIKSRQYAPLILLDVQKLLKDSGMELYAKPCCERIKTAGCVDGVHVSPSYLVPWNLQADIQGVEKCRKILEAYIQPERIDSAQQSFKAYNGWPTSINNILYLLKKAGRKGLRARDVDVLGYKAKAEDIADVKELLKAELLYRTFPLNLYQAGKRIAFVGHLLASFRGPMRLLVPFLREAWGTWENNGCMVCNEMGGKHGKALERFLNAHGGITGIKRLRGNALIRYVFLAVKVYGEENKAEHNHFKVKSCREIESRYQELKQLLEAIGRLTVKDLLQMYPITKDFKGANWGSKDYFYTVEKLKAYSMGNPIGSAQDVACLLWNYQNRDLEWVLLQWMNVIGDLKIYCNNDVPEKQFHELLLKDAG